MMKLIQAACRWGQKDLDEWVIRKARHCLHSRLEPAPCESIPEEVVPGYVLLETIAYDTGRLSCQSLEICLVDINVLRNTGNIKKARYMPERLAMTFLPGDLKGFLSASRDINPIHYGPNTVVPGLWMLSRLEEPYGSHRPIEILPIRLLHPVHVGDSVRLIHKSNVVTGAVGSTTCFTMIIHSPDQT